MGSHGTGRKMGNQKVSEVRCESISPPHSQTHKIDAIQRAREKDSGFDGETAA